MDADRFGTLLRRLQSGSRRGVLRALPAVAIGAFAPLLALSESDAKKKRKKKKKSGPSTRFAPASPPPPCHAARQSCAANGCCNGLRCGDNFCDAVPVCCGAVGAACNEDCDCCGSQTCEAGVCGCPGRDVACGDTCCDTGAETCAWQAETCQSGVCPVATDYCTDPETYLCAESCSCMTSLANVTVCTSMPDTCITCSNDQNCSGLGERAVCVPYDTRFCGGICQVPGPGFCVPGVCLDLPSGLAAADSAPLIKEPEPATTQNDAAEKARPARAQAKQPSQPRTREPKHRTKKRRGH